MQKMHMQWTCACGHVVHADSEQELVKKAQDHTRTTHGKQMTREEVLKTAKKG